MPSIEPRLNEKDKALVRLFMASCFHKWELLEDLGNACYKAGCTIQEIRGTVRHLIVVAGYGPCLAATLHLHRAKLLPEQTPGKVGGPPGDAFEVVYGKVTDRVRRNMHAADPVLGEYIRLHLYGDIYSSPGIGMRQKQLLMVAFLGQANMHDQLFGHLIAAFRFGVEDAEALKAVDMAFELAPAPSPAVYKGSMKTLALDATYPDALVLCAGPKTTELQHMTPVLPLGRQAIRKHQRASSSGDEVGEPTVTIPDPDSIRSPPLPPLFNEPDGHDESLARSNSSSSNDLNNNPPSPVHSSSSRT